MLMDLQAGVRIAPDESSRGLLSALTMGSLQVGVLGTVERVDIQRLSIDHLLNTSGTCHDDGDDDAYRNERGWLLGR